MAAGRFDTNYLESEAILAAQEGDENEVDRILSRMTEMELRTLRRASYLLAMRCEIWEKSGGMPL